MSALQQRSQTYRKANIPDIALSLRYGEISNIERLDAQRKKMLRVNAAKKRLELDLEKIKELESYYSMRRSSMSKNSGIRRKIDTSMVSVLFPSYDDVADSKNKQNIKNAKSLLKKSSKKRKVVANDAVSKQNEAMKMQKAVNIKGTLSAVATIILVFLMLSTVLIRYAEISNQTYLNAQTEKKIQSLETEISKLDMDRALKEDLTSVQYAAATKGMAQPGDEQVIFVSVNPELPDRYTIEDTASAGIDAEETASEPTLNDAQTADNALTQSSSGPLEELNSFFAAIGKTLQGWFK